MNIEISQSKIDIEKNDIEKFININTDKKCQKHVILNIIKNLFLDYHYYDNPRFEEYNSKTPGDNYFAFIKSFGVNNLISFLRGKLSFSKYNNFEASFDKIAKTLRMMGVIAVGGAYRWYIRYLSQEIYYYINNFIDGQYCDQPNLGRFILKYLNSNSKEEIHFYSKIRHRAIKVLGINNIEDNPKWLLSWYNNYSYPIMMHEIRGLGIEEKYNKYIINIKSILSFCFLKVFFMKGYCLSLKKLILKKIE